MPDPLTASSALGLIPSCQAFGNYIYLVKNAKNDAQQLVRAVSTTRQALKQFLKILDGQEGNSFDEHLPDLRSNVVECRNHVECLLKKLGPIAQGDSLFEQIKWPFSKADFRQEVDDLKANAHLFLDIAKLQLKSNSLKRKSEILGVSHKILAALPVPQEDLPRLSIPEGAPREGTIAETEARIEAETPAPPAYKPNLNGTVRSQETDSKLKKYAKVSEHSSSHKTLKRVLPCYGSLQSPTQSPPPSYTPKDTSLFGTRPSSSSSSSSSKASRLLPSYSYQSPTPADTDLLLFSNSSTYSLSDSSSLHNAKSGVKRAFTLPQVHTHLS